MKKITLCFFICLIIFSNNLYATTEEAIISEQDVSMGSYIVEDKIKQIDTKAVVTKIGEIKNIQTGSITDTVQEVTVEILEGEYEAKEFTTNYILTYDIDGKIKAYELNVGDKVSVQLTEDEHGDVTAVVQNVIRDIYIYIMFALFLLIIIFVGGKQGVKAIIGLIITMLSVYFILIKGIYNRI